MPEVYRVQVKLKNLVLREKFFEPHCDDDLFGLTGYALLVGKEQVSRELLSYCACSLNLSAFNDVRP